jgi:hypothetical protein
MSTSRFILRYRGKDPYTAADVEQLEATPRITVLDRTPRMLLVEGDEAQLRKLIGSMPSWAMTPERTIELDDPRPRPRSADEDR